MTITLLTGDCRELMSAANPVDCLIIDPPYGDTSLPWDKRVAGWERVAHACLKPTGSLWLFGSFRYLMAAWPLMQAAGFKYVQDITWEKHNGSGFHADRFKRVHEHIVHFYRDDAPWAKVYNDVQQTMDADAKKVIRRKRPTHMGHIERGAYETTTGGPRIMRSVIYMPSCHGEAIHPTEKPVGLLEILIRTSCPPNGLVGDFFAGSCAVGVACGHTGRNYIGTEIDHNMASAGRARLSGELFSRAFCVQNDALGGELIETTTPNSQECRSKYPDRHDAQSSLLG